MLNATVGTNGLNHKGYAWLLPKYIAAFLEHRTFSVRIKNTKFYIKIQQNGTPQGSILSVVSFAIKIKNIIETMPVDDNVCLSFRR